MYWDAKSVTPLMIIAFDAQLKMGIVVLSTSSLILIAG